MACGGFTRPETGAEAALLAASIALSVVVGLIRGRLTRLWPESGGVYAQGTVLTIALFLGMVVIKFALGTAAYFWDISDDGGFGEVLLMIGIMVAFQVEIIWRRAAPLGARLSTAPAAASNR